MGIIGLHLCTGFEGNRLAMKSTWDYKSAKWAKNYAVKYSHFTLDGRSPLWTEKFAFPRCFTKAETFQRCACKRIYFYIKGYYIIYLYWYINNDQFSEYKVIYYFFTNIFFRFILLKSILITSSLVRHMYIWDFWDLAIFGLVL